MVGIVVVCVVFLIVLSIYKRQQSSLGFVRASRELEINYSFTVNEIDVAAKEVLVWVPIPPNNEGQRLKGFVIEGGMPYEIVEEAEYGNRFLLIDLSDEVDLGMAEISIRFDVERFAIDPKDSTNRGSVEEWRLDRYLMSDSLVPIDGIIEAEALSVVGNVKEPLQRARAIYDHIVASIVYDKSGQGWGRGDAIYACSVRRGNCTDFHSLFIGQMRSLGVPARFVMGLPVPEGENEGTIGGYHCWGEFYISDKGWLPVDASEAYRNPDKKELFFGGLDENRVAFTIGRDIQIPGSNSGRLNYSIYPYVEIDGVTWDDVSWEFTFKDN
jgi:hypothetical protein